MRRTICLPILCGALAAAVSCSDSAGPLVAPAPHEMLPITRILPLHSSPSYREPDRFVVRDAEHWARLWEELFSNYVPMPELYELDFSANMVIVAAMGMSPPGDRLAIDSVFTYSSGRVAVIVRSYSCVVHLGPGWFPMDVVIVPRRDTEMRFFERVGSCPW